MNIYLFISQAISSIFANKMRSVLSTLGIIIGISSFVIMLSMWEWAKQSIVKEFSWSNNVITLQKKSGENLKGKELITQEISHEIPRLVPGVKQTFIKANGSFALQYKDTPLYGSLQWIQQWYMQEKELKLLYGTMFDDLEYLSNEKRIILWNKLVSSTFKKENPIGKKISISGENFIVSWVLAEKNWEFDYTAFIPYSTLKNVLNVEDINGIEVIVNDPEQLDSVKENLDYFLYKKSGVEKKSEVSFETRTNKEVLKQVNDIVGKMSLLLGGIGAIALVVWGIGIMNIMLVSVTERTREIGIRKAIGASNKNILMQFLIESIILTLIGSLLALLFSLGVVKLIDSFIPDFSPVINVNVILIATGVSVAMWILFGLMPAYKAAKLKPIDALHFE